MRDSLRPDGGSIDSSFTDPNLFGRIHAVGVLPNGKLIVGGRFNIGPFFGNELQRHGYVRLLANGTIDNSFFVGGGASATGGATVQRVAVQPDGKALIAGLFTYVNNISQPTLARIQEPQTMNVSVSGRVTTPSGLGLRNASVSITDSLGVRRTVTTTSFWLFQPRRDPNWPDIYTRRRLKTIALRIPRDHGQ